MATTKISTVQVDGIDLFYRSAGSPSSPTILLLHGFPSSSHQYRNLIPLLSTKYHVLAPDFPGYGFTVVPAERKYEYNFANLATTTMAFLDTLGITRFAVYIFDYGSPVAFRIALQRPAAISAIVTQNGNAYTAGLASFWDPLRAYWASDSPEDRQKLKDALLVFDATRWQYLHGNPSPDAVPPETYHLDQALMERPGNKDIQLDLLRDYASNLPLYPAFQAFLRDSKVPVLAAWGRNDEIFVKEGAEAFRADVESSRLEVHLLDAPHFALEGREEVFAGLILGFLGRHGV